MQCGLFVLHFEKNVSFDARNLLLKKKNAPNAICVSRHSTGADNYVSYSERHHLACCGVCSLDVSSTQRAKNSPQDCFLNALSNPVMLQYENNHSLSAMVIFCGADNGIRTRDLVLTKDALCLLSYISLFIFVQRLLCKRHL